MTEIGTNKEKRHSSKSIEALERTNRIAYIIEAALEYFISLLVTGAFLASLLKSIGVSDAATGIITSFSTLGFLAQAAVIMIRPRRSPKRVITLLHLVNQLMFVVLYMLPFVSVPRGIKTAIFAVMLLGGHLLSNAVMPLKLNWLMSFVDDKHRGEFTANKEIISLIGGIVFSYAMGAVADHFTESGRSELGFAICGLTLFAITLLHLLSLLAVTDTDRISACSDADAVSASEDMRTLFHSRDFIKIMLLDVLYHVGTGISISYFGTYQIGELGFSLKYVAVLNALYSIVRVAFSRFFGRFADKYSWRKMMIVSFSIAAAGFFINSFTVPSNGKILYTVYYMFYAIYMAGANSGIMNLAFDYVDEKNRASALGIKSALGGTAGFLASLLGARILSVVQANGNTLFGHTIYAQQLLSFISFAVYVAAAVYTKKIIHNKTK